MTTSSGDLAVGCRWNRCFESTVWHPVLILRGRRVCISSCELGLGDWEVAVAILQHAPALSILVAKCRFNVPYKAPFEFGLSSQI